ncbi:MAG: LarC family nickel insertion protein, partial [Propionibacteriaceae bacterium]|nr:LarC family nickel insertion protein [Propionibacteriaceae bacterium]
MHAWFDISAGVAGDMLLGALIDAGADTGAVQDAIDAVAPGSVRLEHEPVTRGGQRATKARVRVLVDDPPHRTWRTIREALASADLHDDTRQWALGTFAHLAAAEARAHGIDVDAVHFHEVGALDSIADVIGACEALRLLGVTSVSASPVRVGAGRVRAAHGDIPVPVPAVAELVLGWQVHPTPAEASDHHHHHHDHSHDHARDRDHHHDHGHTHGHDSPAAVTTPGSVGELATPTGMALIRALAADRCEPLPGLTVRAVGVGAGGKDIGGWPNVVRVVVGETAAAIDSPATELTELRANVDDLDPRLWPGVLDALLEAGAADAWLVPIQMKKGRPGFTLHA